MIACYGHWINQLHVIKRHTYLINGSKYNHLINNKSKYKCETKHKESNTNVVGFTTKSKKRKRNQLFQRERVSYHYEAGSVLPKVIQLPGVFQFQAPSPRAIHWLIQPRTKQTHSLRTQLPSFLVASGKEIPSALSKDVNKIPTTFQ